MLFLVEVEDYIEVEADTEEAAREKAVELFYAIARTLRPSVTLIAQPRGARGNKCSS